MREKINKALSLIKEAGIKDEIVTEHDVYEEMKKATLCEVAEILVTLTNLVYEVREVLESD